MHGILLKCKEMGIDKVFVTCEDTNVASRKCILANGGQYEDTRTIKEENMICPKCGSKLIIRDGKNGKFIGCTNYPKCRFTKNMEKK